MILTSDLPSLAHWDAALAAHERRSPRERLTVEPLGALIDAEMAAEARRAAARPGSSPPEASRLDSFRSEASGPKAARAASRSAPSSPARATGARALPRRPAPAGRPAPDDAEARILDHIGVPARPTRYTRADIDACRSDARRFRWPSACAVEACRRSGRCRGPLQPLAGAPARMPACLRLLARRRWGPGLVGPEDEARIARMLAPLRSPGPGR